MNGTEWLYRLRDEFTKPLENIYEDLQLTDRAATTLDNDLSALGQDSSVTTLTSQFDDLRGSIIGSAGGFAVWDIASGIISGVASSLGEAVSGIVQTRGEYQKFEAVLNNSFGSVEAGAAAFEMIKSFAASTPYEVDQITQSFIKMRAQGFTPTEVQMRQLGDIASSMAKDYDQLAEAILDAQTGEFERLKEFGIKAASNGQKVMFTFKGITTEVDKNAQSIRDYILGIGDMQGVQNSMASIMDTIPGKISNIDDASAALQNRIGLMFEPAINSWYEFQSQAIQGMMDFVEWIDANGETISNVFEAIAVSVGLAAGAYLALNAEMLLGQGIAGASILLIKGLEMAQWAWNLAMNANPLGVVIGLLAAFAGVVYYAYETSETFRAGVLGTWEAIQVLAAGVWDIAITPFRAWLEILQSAGEILLGVFTLDYGMIKSGMDNAMAALEAANPLDKVMKLGEDMGTAFNEGYNGSLAADAAKAKAEDKSVVTAETAVAGKTTPLTSSNVKQGADNYTASSAAGGGGSSSSSRSINVRIDTLGKITINNGGVGIGDTVSEVKRIIHEELVAAVRDFEVSIANG